MHTVHLSQLAARQFGVVSWHQLRAAGVSGATVSAWVARGLLHPLHPRVYAVGHPTLTAQGRWMAAQLWAGMLGYSTAAMIIGLSPPYDVRPHVIVPPGKSARNAALHVHRCALPAHHVTMTGPLRHTTWARAIVDIADSATDRQLKSLLDKAVELELYDQPVIDEAIAHAKHRRGPKRLVALIAQLDDRPPTYRSKTERRIADELVLLGLPAPEVNASLPRGDGTYVELDLYWRRQRVNAEIDGPHHELPFQKLADAKRDDWLDTQRILVRRYPARGLRAARIAAEIGPLLAAREAA